MMQEIKQGFYVVGGSILLLGLSFIVYFALFRVIQVILNPDGRFGFVVFLRIAYGVILVLLAYLSYGTKMPEWFKVSSMSAGLGTFLLGLSVSLYETPVIAYIFAFAILCVVYYWLYTSQQKWFHYLPILVSLIAMWVYI